MRAHVPALALSLLLACTDDKDPLDGLTAGATTTATTGDSGDASGDPPGTSSAATTNSTTTTTTGPVTTSFPEPTTAEPDPETSSTSSSGTTAATEPTTLEPDPDPLEAARQLCVDTINMYRATLGLPPYARWTDAETCSDEEAQIDGETNTPHGSFGMCGEFAQNECPGWPGPPEQSLPGCLAQMWAEGPGEDFNKHGHYINMSSEQYTRVSCGFAEVNGSWWMTQNFQ